MEEMDISLKDKESEKYVDVQDCASDSKRNAGRRENRFSCAFDEIRFYQIRRKRDLYAYFACCCCLQKYRKYHKGRNECSRRSGSSFPSVFTITWEPGWPLA